MPVHVVGVMQGIVHVWLYNAPGHQYRHVVSGIWPRRPGWMWGGGGGAGWYDSRPPLPRMCTLRSVNVWRDFISHVTQPLTRDYLGRWWRQHYTVTCWYSVGPASHCRPNAVPTCPFRLFLYNDTCRLVSTYSRHSVTLASLLLGTRWRGGVDSLYRGVVSRAWIMITDPHKAWVLSAAPCPPPPPPLMTRRARVVHTLPCLSTKTRSRRPGNS